MNRREKVEKLYRMYKNIMFKEAFDILNDEMLAEDAVSESFVRMINNIGKIEADGSRHTLNFLLVVCRNVAKDIYNRRKLENKIFCSMEEEPVSEMTPETIVVDQESVNKIVDIIMKMNPIYKDVVILSKLYNITRRDIAKMFGITETTVTKRLQRAKIHIKNSLERMRSDG